jgi:hypothetical protein
MIAVARLSEYLRLNVIDEGSWEVMLIEFVSLTPPSLLLRVMAELTEFYSKPKLTHALSQTCREL